MKKIIILLFLFLKLTAYINAQEKIKVIAEKDNIFFELSVPRIHYKVGESVTLSFDITNNSNKDIFVFDYIFKKSTKPSFIEESNRFIFEMGGSWQPEFSIISKLRLIKKHNKTNIRLNIDTKTLQIIGKKGFSYDISIQFGFFNYSKLFKYLTMINEEQITVSEAEINDFISLHKTINIGKIPIVIK
jgi:hypothetical protein